MLSFPHLRTYFQRMITCQIPTIWRFFHLKPQFISPFHCQNTSLNSSAFINQRSFLCCVCFFNLCGVLFIFFFFYSVIFGQLNHFSYSCLQRFSYYLGTGKFFLIENPLFYFGGKFFLVNFLSALSRCSCIQKTACI